MTIARTTIARTTIARLAAILAIGAVASCGLSNTWVNPFNWFGRSENRVVLAPEGGFGEKVDYRHLVEQVTELTVEPVTGGAVIRATGLPPTQGYWDGELVSQTDLVPDEKGALALEFRISPPLDPAGVSVPRSREVVVGLFISRQKLATVREIRVQGKTNVRSVRR